MWSVGCVFAELLAGKPMFPGKDEMDLLEKISRVLGSPTEATMPGCSRLPLCAPPPPGPITLKPQTLNANP